jgi:hypothetical protein
MRKFFLTAAAILAGALGQGRVDADSIVEYELFGAPGNQALSAATFEAVGVDGLSITRGAGLTATAAGNAFSASGWNNLEDDDYFQLGFTVDAGYQAIVDQLIIASRSSGTGPGFVDVDVSIDGDAFVTLATIVQMGTNFTNSILDLGGLAVTSSLTIRLMVDRDQTASANGGSIGAAGTFRIGDYLDSGVFTPITLTGSVVPAQTVVPEPSSHFLACAGGLGVAALRARRRRRDG